MQNQRCDVRIGNEQSWLRRLRGLRNIGQLAWAFSSQVVTFMVVKMLAPTTLYGANSEAMLFTAGESRLQYQFCMAQLLLKLDTGRIAAIGLDGIA